MPHYAAFVDLLGLLVAKDGVSAGAQAETIVVKWDSTVAQGLIAAWWIIAAASAAWQWWWYEGLVDEVRPVAPFPLPRIIPLTLLPIEYNNT